MVSRSKQDEFLKHDKNRTRTIVKELKKWTLLHNRMLKVYNCIPWNQTIVTAQSSRPNPAWWALAPPYIMGDAYLEKCKLWAPIHTPLLSSMLDCLALIANDALVLGWTTSWVEFVRRLSRWRHYWNLNPRPQILFYPKLKHHQWCAPELCQQLSELKSW